MAQLKDLIVNGSSTLVGDVSVSTINGVTVGDSPEFTDTDTSVTSSANHYTPETASGQDKTASASGATAAWSIDVVQGVTLNTDGKGHVTGVSVTSGKVPANPNTDTAVSITATNPSSTTIYYPVWHTATSGTSVGLKANDGMAYSTKNGTASAVGYGVVVAGNATASGTAGNKQGYIRLYSTTANHVQLTPVAGVTENRTINLPDKAGTVALTSDIPTTLDEVTNGSTRVLIPFNTIGNYTTAGKNYTVFASVSSSSTSRYKDCIVLVSGGGYYYGGGLTGQWLVEMRSSTDGAPSMKVIQLVTPSTSSTINFGYYTANNVTYFGMYSSSRRGEISTTSLLNNSGLFTLYNNTTKPAIVTAAPDGWTAATINKIGLDVPSWAMAADKPAYTASEVGALAGSISRVAVTANLTNVDPAASLASGSQMHVIYYNNGSADYTISVATTYVSPDGNQINLTCPQGGYCELNVMNIDGVKYARGI